MTDLLKPEDVRKHKERMEQFGDFPELTFQLRLCRNYLTLWDVLEREREISDEAVKRVTQLEQEIGALMR